MTIIAGAADCSTANSVSNRIFNNLVYDNPWQASATGVQVDALCCPTTPNGIGYKCTAATTGVTDTVEPTWPLVLGNSVVDGGVTWTAQDVAKPSGRAVWPAKQFGFPQTAATLKSYQLMAADVAQAIIDSVNTEKVDGSTQVSGGSGLTPISKSASYAASAGQLVVVTALTANVVITLPSAASAGAGAQVGVKDAAIAAGGGTDGSGHLLSVNAASGAIDGVSSVVIMDDGAYVTFISDGSNWWATEGEDHVGIDPRSISGLAAWYDFGRGYTYSTPGVTTSVLPNIGITALADQSGNGLTLSYNASHGFAPCAARGGLTGRARGLFQGNSSLETANIVPSASTVTVIAVMQSVLKSTGYQAVVGQNANGTLGAGFAAFANSADGGNVNESPKMFTSGETHSTYGNVLPFNTTTYEIPLTPHCMAWANSATAPYIHMDGLDITISPVVSSAVISSPTSARLFVGQDFYGGSVADYFYGTISELMVFFPALSPAAAKALSQSLMKKHRIRV